jgi:acyl-coenzyme A thioesterase PaaI-like protein
MVTVTSASPDGAAAAIPDAPEIMNHVGSQHAGALFTLAEAASGAAMIGAFADVMAGVTPLVRQAAIRYLKVARGPIIATARLSDSADKLQTTLAGAGRVDFKVFVELVDSAGHIVAEADYEWALRKRG